MDIYVGGLAEKVDEKILNAAFIPFGEMVDVFIKFKINHIFYIHILEGIEHTVVFSQYPQHSCQKCAAENCMRYVNDWDADFVEGGQYGHDMTDGQVRDEYKSDFDNDRECYSKIIQQLMTALGV
ncbi:hypothetical protein PV326_009215 [Microctonus aethiopoides]|nr:hypothetical protein PV326_009215 [Microctonus aethiopoides]